MIAAFQLRYLDSAARLYQHAYAVPEMVNLTPEEASREIIVGHHLRESFIGSLALDDHQKVIGLAWGYEIPAKNEGLLRRVAKSLGQEWIEKTFVIEAFAVHHEHYNSDIAHQLHGDLTQRIQEAGYERVRVRLDTARMDNVPEVLLNEGWQILQRLPHVMWLGRVF
ncbi:MAG: GNAT family N-acetyltransferase [Anaerolineae bacterium]|nr:GNAT family N-acetyltransferase [Anaerolineae bacterium]